jgi:hypothetical protein
VGKLRLIMLLGCCTGLAIACSTQQPARQGYDSAGAQTIEPFFDPAALPKPAEVLAHDAVRSVAVLDGEQLFHHGADNIEAARAAPDGTDLNLLPAFDTSGTPEFSDLAYAIYAFDIPEYSGAAIVRTYWPVPAEAGAAYIGVSDFAGNCWRWHPVSAGGVAQLGSMAGLIHASGRLYCVVALTGTDVATLGTVRIGQTLIEGQLRALPQSMTAPFVAELDATSLTIAGASIVQYAFDTDGDGQADVTNSTGVASANMGAVEVRNVFVECSTSEGQVFRRTIALHGLLNIWVAEPLVTSQSSSEDYRRPVLGVVAGKPCLTYIYEAGDPPDIPYTSTVKLHMANDPLATGWGGPQLPAGLIDMNRVFSIVDADGKPAVLTGNINKVMTLCLLNAAGTAWELPFNVGSSGDKDRAAALAAFDGKFGLAYCDSLTNQLWYKQTTGFNTEFNEPILLGESTGELALLASEAERWIFSVFPGAGDGPWLTLRRASDPPSQNWLLSDAQAYEAVSTWWPTIAATGQGVVGLCAAGNDSQLLFWRNSEGSATRAKLETTAEYCSLAAPCLQYSAGFSQYSGGGVKLVLLELPEAGPIDNQQDEVTADSGAVESDDVGAYCSLVVLEGVPIIAYEDRTNYGIRVAVLR